MKRLKVVHIIQMLMTGGAEKIVLELSRAMHTKTDVSIICLYPKQGHPYEEIAEENGIKVIYLNKKKGFDAKTVIKLWELLSKIKPDVIHTHLEAAVYPIFWYAFHWKNARIHTVHQIAPLELNFAHRLIQKAAFHLLKVTPVGISDTLKTGILKEYRLKASQVPVIYNGIQVKDFTYENRQYDKNIITLVNVASMNDRKNQSLLIEAFYRALRKIDSLRLILVGDGPLRIQYQNKIQELGIQDKVDFVGITDRVSEYLKKSDIFILSSKFEGLPVCLLEAMACGLPVISTDVGGVRDIIQNGINGIVTKNEDIETMQNAIEKLASDKNMRISISSANAKKAEKYDIERIAGQYIELYYKKLGEKV